MATRLILACLAIQAGAVRAGEYTLPLLPEPPRLDGRIDPAEWSFAARLDGFGWQHQLERRRAVAWVGATSDTLYLAVRSQLPADGGKLIAQVQTDTLKVVYDDSVEVWLDLTPGAEQGRTLQMIANPLGRVGYKLHPRGGLPEEPTWHGDWQVANGFTVDAWELEVAIPLGERAATDGSFGVNLCRNWKQPWGFSSVGGGAYAPVDVFRFVPNAPAIGFAERGDVFLGQLDGRLTFRNPAAQPVTLKVDWRVARDAMPELNRLETVTVPAGGESELKLAAEDLPTKKFRQHLEVTSADGATAFYDRETAWQRGEPWVWSVEQKPVLPLDCQFAYYPYRNRMRVNVDVSNLPSDAVLKYVDCTIRQKGEDPVKTIRFDQFAGGKQAQEFALPPLEGSYELVLTAAGTKVPEGELVKPFERQVFPWEHLGLGDLKHVYPPFTPLKYADGKVLSVLREHTTNESGLWSQVVAAGQPLLAAPMQYQLQVDGQPVAPAPGRWDMEPGSPADWRIVYHGSFGSALKFDYHCQWDVDGTMRQDLTLPATDGKSIDELTLAIPLRADQATYLHAMGDGIRNTIYRKLPDGEGEIWTSKGVAVEDLPAGFCSYLYVGTPNRGLSWFAENDRGWSWDRTKPNITIERQGEVVWVKIHVVNRPTKLDQPQTLTFGLLAAPVKPRLSPWRYRWNRDRYTLLGTDINWFALGDCGAVYPAKQDMYLWEMLAKGNREQLDDATIKAVRDHGRPYFEPYGPAYVERWERHVNYNLRSRYGKKMVFYYNRASYQAAPEFQTFQDEWDLTDYRTVGPGHGVGEIKIIPTESYIDHALYWYGKSFDVGGNQGVYWDNWFFKSSFNTEMSDAYRRPDGSTMPATGLWGMRELSRRTFQYLNERGMLPITMPHMTSTNILPMHSFATVQYDWEWKYSEGDVQNRFRREYILLVSNGQLAGAWPVLLGDHGKLATDPWTQRTYAAVCLVHELNGYGLPKVWDPLLKPVCEIIDQPDVEVYRYWDDRPQPVKSDNPDLPSIVYSVPGKSALVGVCSYVDGDVDAVLSVDAKALGFAKGWQATDVESGAPVEVVNGQLRFALKKHDLKLVRLTRGE